MTYSADVSTHAPCVHPVLLVEPIDADGVLAYVAYGPSGPSSGSSE